MERKEVRFTEDGQTVEPYWFKSNTDGTQLRRLKKMIDCPECGGELELFNENEVICFTRDGYPVRDDQYKCKNCTSIFPLDYLEMLIEDTSKDEDRRGVD